MKKGETVTVSAVVTNKGQYDAYETVRLGLFLEILGVLFIVIFTNKGKESSDSSIIGILFMILAVLSGSMFSVFFKKVI